MKHLSINGQSSAYDGSVISRIANQNAMREIGVEQHAYSYFSDKPLTPRECYDLVAPDELGRAQDWIVDYPTYTPLENMNTFVRYVHHSLHVVYAYIYDLDCLRYAGYDIDQELRLFDGYIVPSLGMRDFLIKELDLPAARFYVVNPSAYPYTVSHTGENRGLVYAGNLSEGKAGFIRSLPYPIDVYGQAGFEVANPMVTMHEAMIAPDLQRELGKYTAGLVWDSGDLDKVSYRSYMKYNWPCKADTYMAAALPIIAPTGTNIGRFIEENKIGVTIDSLTTANLEHAMEAVSKLDPERVREVGFEQARGLSVRDVIEDIVRRPILYSDLKDPIKAKERVIGYVSHRQTN